MVDHHPHRGTTSLPPQDLDSSGETGSLYEKVLGRYEEDYEKERPGLVGEAMSLLWASRRGLSEAELLDLLGPESKPLPRAVWSPLYLAAEESLVTRSGLITFFHDHLREAVEHRYVGGHEKSNPSAPRSGIAWGNRSGPGNDTTS